MTDLKTVESATDILDPLYAKNAQHEHTEKPLQSRKRA